MLIAADPSDVGWRDRDYAKFRKDEFEAIYGQGTPEGSYATATGLRTGRRTRWVRRRRASEALRALRLLALAVVTAAVLLGAAIATGKVNDIDSRLSRTPLAARYSVLPSLQTPLENQLPVPRHTTRIAGTRLLDYGGTFTISGSHTPMTGTVVISGRWDTGDWETFAVARGSSRTFAFRLPLMRRGVLHIRIAYPNGSRAVGTYDVR